MDEHSALPPENWKPHHQSRSSTVRTEGGSASWRSSHNSQHPKPLTINTAAAAQSDMPLILAPTPRRHLIESSASQHWLHQTSSSPPSSRSASPISQTSRQGSTSYDLTTQPGGSAHYQQQNSDSIPDSTTLGVPTLSNVVRRRRPSGSISKQNRPQDGPHKRVAYHQSGSASLSGDAIYGSVGGLKVQALEPDESTMSRRWLRWMHKRGLKRWVVPGILGVSTVVKLMIGLGSYSGHATPPTYGDYEAQRHWMEITKHLPLKQWYAYDLQYWGLDYPPLTAYVSWLCGVIAHWINPSWVALKASRGIETPESKVFMRLTVVIFDLLVYVPALVMFSRTWQGSRLKRTQERSILTLILQPALLLIDFGHFQYNSVMLGLALLAINFFALGQDTVGAFFFVLSLGFKQMALYYAPAIGSYLLAKCLSIGPVEGGRLFFRLATVTLSTFILLFLPWLPPFASFPAILQPIIRIFPFARGLFEDKVANFWCASNVVVKWKTRASPSVLVKLSTLLTVAGFLPAVIGFLRAGVTTAPSLTKDDKGSEMQKSEGSRELPAFIRLLPHALLTSSMSFFLFSFQVHEKTILLPLMPMTLLLSSSSPHSAEYDWGVLFNNIAVFSMWPLLKRDGLGVQYIATLILWNRLLGFNPFRLRPHSFVQFVSMGVYTAAAVLHVMELMIRPPSRYPDIYPVLNVLISTPVFILVWLWSIKCGVEEHWALGGLGRTAPESLRENSEDAASLSGGGSPRVVLKSY